MSNEVDFYPFKKKRLRILYVLFMCVAVAIVIRLFFLQVFDQKELTKKSRRKLGS